ncbi:MAG TPA: tetratricopeptide repeat protein [Bacteroidia bacterium]|nr:tetratricopeptide repeat protein [Bacteroidia bacterium]
MAGGRTLRIGLIAGALVTVTVIYLLPKTTPTDKPASDQTEVNSETANSFSFDQFVASAKTKIGWDSGNKVGTWDELIKDNKAELSVFDSVAKVWDEAHVPGISAWYYEQKALKSGIEKDWLSASYRYFDAYKNGKDSLETAYFVSKAITGYSKVLEINPQNLDAKTDLGVLYTEGTKEPMKGIALLREVISANPNHENAQLNLGLLSMKSGQFEKAVERFKKVNEINPARIDMYVYMGEAYVRAGNKEKAIENLKIFKNLSNDEQMIKDVDDYIKSLEEIK